LPGALASAYDRASLTRNLALPVAIAVMSSAGFEWASRALWPRVRSGRAAAAAAIVVATGGTVLFDVVNPRILASSSMALILGALGKEAPEKSTLVLDHGDAAFHWLNVQLIARYLPASPLDVRSYKTAATLARSESDPRPAADLFFWSPGLEEEARISEAICERWPSTVLYRLVDTSGLSSAFAASPSGARWRPALPETQWHFEQCSGFRGKDAGPGGGT
jgi:hypothetical protein